MRERGEWACIVCGKLQNFIVCHECEKNEKNKQRCMPKTITNRQASYIERLLRKVKQFDITDIFPEHNGEIDDLSENQAGWLIAQLLAYIANNPPMCEECGKVQVEFVGYFCEDCYANKYHNGVKVAQCAAIKSSGYQCGNIGRFENGLCRIHKSWPELGRPLIENNTKADKTKETEQR